MRGPRRWKNALMGYCGRGEGRGGGAKRHDGPQGDLGASREHRGPCQEARFTIKRVWPDSFPHEPGR